MAKIPHPGSIGRGDVLRARQRIHYKRGRGGILVVQKWPRRRGKKKTPLQQAWVNDFTASAKKTKQPDPCALQISSSMSPNTGWYYRDVLHAALHGKLINAAGQFGPNAGSVSALQIPPKKLDGGVFRVLTPTAFVDMSAPVAVPSTALFVITPNEKKWDNSAFWDSASHPTRLTCKATGLYLFGAVVNWSHSSSGAREARMRVNGTTQIARAVVDASHNNDHTISLVTIWPMMAGDYIEAQCSSSATGITYQLQNFWALAITPETLVP